MAEEFPIAEQSGLDEKTIKSMEPVEQKFKQVTDYTMTANKGVNTQKEQLKNLVLKALIDYNKAKSKIDPKDEFGLNKCMDAFVEDLSSGMSEMISAQKWTVTTKDNVTIKVPSYEGAAAGSKGVSGEGIGSAKSNVTNSPITIK